MSEPTEAPGGRSKKVTLSVKEQQLIESYRRKTEADRAFNDGLDHALECLPLAVGDYFNSAADKQAVQERLEAWREAIESARRDV